MPDVYYVNGSFADRDEAVVPVEDRGFQFGDGVYEVIRAYGQQMFCPDEHIDRLSKSLEAINIAGVPLLEIKAICGKALERSGYDDAFVYIQITRGVARRSHIPPSGMQPSVVIIVYKTPVLPAELFQKGAKTILCPDIRWAKCHIKTLQLLPNTIVLTKAAAESAIEAILHRDGIVTECGSSNLFIVKNNTVKTHPADETILHGVSRKIVLDILKSKHMPAREEMFTVDELLNADEVFITNTLVEVMPITSVDDKLIAGGYPGPVTVMLAQEFRRLIGA